MADAKTIEVGEFFTIPNAENIELAEKLDDGQRLAIAAGLVGLSQLKIQRLTDIIVSVSQSDDELYGKICDMLKEAGMTELSANIDTVTSHYVNAIATNSER